VSKKGGKIYLTQKFVHIALKCYQKTYNGAPIQIDCDKKCLSIYCFECQPHGVGKYFFERYNQLSLFSVSFQKTKKSTNIPK
jgi:hypothetical protein